MQRPAAAVFLALSLATLIPAQETQRRSVPPDPGGRRQVPLRVESHRFGITLGTLWSAPFTIPPFDESKGTLVRVDVTTIGTISWDYTVENPTGSFVLALLPASATILLRTQAGSQLGFTLPDKTSLIGLPATDGAFDCQGSSSFNYAGSASAVVRRTFAPSGLWVGRDEVELRIENTHADFGSPTCVLTPPSAGGHAVIDYVYRPRATL